MFNSKLNKWWRYWLRGFREWLGLGVHDQRDNWRW
jgi:hypothetical protein